MSKIKLPLLVLPELAIQQINTTIHEWKRACRVWADVANKCLQPETKLQTQLLKVAYNRMLTKAAGWLCPYYFTNDDKSDSFRHPAHLRQLSVILTMEQMRLLCDSDEDTNLQAEIDNKLSAETTLFFTMEIPEVSFHD